HRRPPGARDGRHRAGMARTDRATARPGTPRAGARLMATGQDTRTWERREEAAVTPRTARTEAGALRLALSRIDRVWAACAVLAALAVLVAAFRPLWSMELLAPQYPGGLHL